MQLPLEDSMYTQFHFCFPNNTEWPGRATSTLVKSYFVFYQRACTVESDDIGTWVILKKVIYL